MYRHKSSSACWATVIGLTVYLTLEPVFINAQVSRRYNLNADSSGPVGMVKSAGQVKINGRLAEGEQLVWNGDFLEAASGGECRVSIESAGQIRLTSKARVRLSVSLNRLGNEANHSVVVASLLSGELAVRLNENACAYIEACGRVFTSSDGAMFRVSIRDGSPFIDSERGAVEAAPTSRDFEFTAEPGSIDRKKRVFKAGQTNLSVERRKQLILALRVKQRQKTKVTSITQVSSKVGSLAVPQAINDWQVAAGKMVTFQLTNPIGTLDGQRGQVVVITDPSGTASVTFEGEAVGATRVIARVKTEPGETSTPDEVFWDITVTAGPGFFRPRNLIIIGAAAAIATYPIWKPKKDIEQIPPPVIIP